MENITLISAKSLITPNSSPNPTLNSKNKFLGFSIHLKKPSGSLLFSKPRSSKTLVFAFSRRKFTSNHTKNDSGNVNVKNVELFARISKAQETTTTTTSSVAAVTPQPYVSPPSSQFGSPLFWIGVGVGFSAIFSFAASWLKKYAMQQAFKSMMGQMGSQNNQFSNAAFPPGSTFGFPPPSTSGTSTYPAFSNQPPLNSGPSTSAQYSTSNVASSSAAPSSATRKPSSPAASMTMDVSGQKSEVTEPVFNDVTEAKSDAKQSAFVDISPEETSQASPFENYDDKSSWRSSEASKVPEVVQNGAVQKEGTSTEWRQETRKKGSMLSVETLEKMMKDPNIQKMIYPQLPEEMRNPETFKWMLQNPVYRQQLQEMLDNMGDGGMDNRMMEGLKSFDLNSPEVKQQFDQIGLTPEEAMSKLMSNPEITMAFQNPKIQQAILDCSQNPMNMMKYQNDKEIMDVFNKMQELFPGPSGF